MVVPTGHLIGGTAFVAAHLNWTFFYLGTWIGGVNAPAGCNFVAIVPFFSDQIVTFNYATYDHDYRWFQYSGPPLQLFLGTYYYGTIFVGNIAFGSMFGWAGVPYSMHYFRIQQVGLTRVPRSEASYLWLQWANPEVPAYLVRDPLIVRYDPYVWVGTEALVAWATMEDFPNRSFDELMTAKNYIDKELVHLPNAPKFVGQFFPVMRGYIGGMHGFPVSTVWSGTLWLWAWTRAEKPYHLFDDERYQYFDPVIKPGGKVLAAGFCIVGSIGVRGIAERHKYPMPGDPLFYRMLFNPAPFEVVEWFNVPAFVVGYFYERRGSYIFEVNYGAVIPPAYVVEYFGTEVLFRVWLATNIYPGSVLLLQSLLAYPRRVEFRPPSYSNLLNVLIDWVHNLANQDRFLLISDYSDALVVTPEDSRSNEVATFMACNIKSYRPFGGYVTEETEDGWEVRFRYTSLASYNYDAVYFKYRTGALTFEGCEPLVIVPLSGGLRWLVPIPLELSMYDFSMDDEPWVFEYPYSLYLQYGDSVIPRVIVDPIAPYTNLPNNRVIDLEKPHRFFYEDVFVLAARGFKPSIVYGSVIRRDWDDPTGDFYIEMPTTVSIPYGPVFVGTWRIPTPIYNAEGNDPYNIMPYLQRFIQRRFKYERDVHSNVLSDVHLRIKTIVNREFVECVITKPLTFFEKRTGRDPGEWFGGTYPFMWLIPVLASPAVIDEYEWMQPTIEFWRPDNFTSFDIRGTEAIPVVLGRTACRVIPPIAPFEPAYLHVFINPFYPLVAEPETSYRFIRWFWHAEFIINSISSFFDALVTGFPMGTHPESITKHEFQAFGPPFHAIGSNLWTTIEVPDKAYPVPAPFISGGAKIVGLGSLYKWAKRESLALPEWFERYIARHGEDGDHFLSGKLKATIVYASYWPIEPAYLQLYVWNYRGTNPYRHFSQALSIYGVFNEDWRFGTILWRPPLDDNYNWAGQTYNRWFNYWFNNNRARLLIPNRGWVEELPAGRMVRIPDPLEVLALYGTATYLDREAIFVKQIVTLGNTSVLLLPRHARYDAFGKTVPYFTQDGGKCPLWMGEPIIGVDGIPYDDGRIVVYVYSVRGVYSFVLTPSGVEDWAFEPVPKWYWKLLTGQT
jgi:hypothetical protein